MNAEVLYSNPAVTVNRFGGEGTGAQIVYYYDWSFEEPITFQIDAELESENVTTYTGRFNNMPLATVRTSGHLMTFCYSFVEDVKYGAHAVDLIYDTPVLQSFRTTLTIHESAPRTFFVGCGCRKGYFGIQDWNDAGKKPVLFSFWDYDSKCVVEGPKPERNMQSAAIRRMASYRPEMLINGVWEPITRGQFRARGEDGVAAGFRDGAYWLSTGGVVVGDAELNSYIGPSRI